MTTGANVQPGWYLDAQGVTRWWDGQQWGMPAPPAPQPVAQQPYRMVTKQPRRTSHGLHLFLTIITAGFWGVFVWLPLTIIHKMHREKVVTRVHG